MPEDEQIQHHLQLLAREKERGREAVRVLPLTLLTSLVEILLLEIVRMVTSVSSSIDVMGRAVVARRGSDQPDHWEQGPRGWKTKIASGYSKARGGRP